MVDILTVLKTYWSVIGFLLGGAGTLYLYFTNSQKRENSLKIDENLILKGDIENVSALLALHRETIDDLRKSFEELKEEYIMRGLAYDNLEKKFNKVSETLLIYDRKIKALSQENMELMRNAKICSECERVVEVKTV